MPYATSSGWRRRAHMTPRSDSIIPMPTRYPLAAPGKTAVCDPPAMTRLEPPGYDVLGIRAKNPGPFTLGGTNSWIVGRNPAWLIDPGPALDEHLELLAAEIDVRGGLGGVALTHDHADHAQATAAVRRRYPDAALAGGRDGDLALSDG